MASVTRLLLLNLTLAQQAPSQHQHAHNTHVCMLCSLRLGSPDTTATSAVEFGFALKTEIEKVFSSTGRVEILNTHTYYRLVINREYLELHF